ncbi:MAG: TetR/AcrR family transcriptional regulator [Clostridia bacterium]|nr:TetR/AcrR family transcriptional regulator [Clostridia bacterium]
MNREEKNQQTRQRILDSALAEFAQQGYGAGSMNTISSAGGLSKGILYHYFETKDELYLACVERCFQALTGYLETNARPGSGTATEQLEAYFGARLAFFQENPALQRIFCDAVIAPPDHLAAGVLERKAPFDALNVEILSRLLEPVTLRPDLSTENVIDMLRQYQDFFNAQCRMTGREQVDIREHEATCRRALSILLYGVVARKEGGMSA